MTSSNGTDERASLIFGRYRVVRRLAIGGMGEIFLAHQVDVTDRLVILKSLLPDLASDPSFVRQFLDEARVVATLSHPNIVNVYEVGSWAGVHYIAMEYVDGSNLGSLIATSLSMKRRFPVGATLRILSEAAAGLDHAHTARAADGSELHIVHRDVSPQNIMVRQDGRTKVVDFGIAKANNRQTRTENGLFKGKLAYMAPEQVESAATAASDQYALGIVAWEMLAQQRLFEGEPLHVLKQVLANEIPAPSKLKNDIAPDIDELVLRMTHRDPLKRFSSLAEVADLLESMLMTHAATTTRTDVGQLVVDLGGQRHTDDAQPQADYVVALSTPETPTTPLGPAPKNAVSTGKRRNVAVAVAAFVLTVATAGVAWRLNARSVEPTPPVATAPPIPSSVVAHEVAPPVTAPASATDPAPALAPADNERPLKRSTTSKPHSAPEDGLLTLSTTPWTRVSIDSAPYGSTPIYRVRLSEGRHSVRLVNDDKGINVSRQVVVKAGQTTKLDLQLSAVSR